MSDHVPLLFVPDVVDTDFPKAFRFKNFWIMGEALLNVVSQHGDKMCLVRPCLVPWLNFDKLNGI